MPKVSYVQHNGAVRSIDAAAGASVMHAALSNGVPGIEAECGGACSCATCHVYVDAAWIDRLPAMRGDEDDLLSCTASERLPNSRLACQITVQDGLDGMFVHVPERQS